jgi:hypothetical protein
MAAAGAQYCFEKRSSERLFRVAKAMVFERLRQEEHHFGPQTLGLIAPSDVYRPETESQMRRAGPWSPLDMAKTLLTLVGFATWERKDLLWYKPFGISASMKPQILEPSPRPGPSCGISGCSWNLRDVQSL